MTTPGDTVWNRFAALPALAQAQIDWLVAQGVPPQAIAEPDVLTTAALAFEGSRFAFPDEADGAGQIETAVIVLLRDEIDGCPLELAAWAPRSGHVGTWAGRACHAGDAFGPRLHEQGALPVYPNMLAWLASGRDGIVIVDDTSPALRDLATFGGPFVATGGIDHARELAEALTPAKPKILIAHVIEKAA
jgi:hypothetical protein